LVISFSVIYPENYNTDKLPAGIVSTLSEEILDFSGFKSAKIAKETLDKKREQATSVRSLMKAFVLATITSYTPEFLDSLTYSQLAEKVALAEQIINVKQAINGMESTNVSLALVDPQEEEAKRQEAINRFEKSRKEGEARIDDPIAQKLWGGS
jgi:hypothetical protein